MKKECLKLHHKISNMKQTINNYFGVDIEQKSRKGEIVRARMFYFLFMRENIKKSLADIGVMENHTYDHASVLHAVKTIKNDIETDKVCQRYYIELKELLRGVVVSDEPDVFSFVDKLIRARNLPAGVYKCDFPLGTRRYISYDSASKDVEYTYKGLIGRTKLSYHSDETICQIMLTLEI